MRPLINCLVAFLLLVQPATFSMADTTGPTDTTTVERHCPDCNDCCDTEPGCEEACPLTDCAGGFASISLDPRVAEILSGSSKIEDPISCLSGGIPPLLLRPPIFA